MKNTFLAIITVLFCCYGFSQDKEMEAISSDACLCIHEIKTAVEDEEKYEKINECISSAIMAYQLSHSLLELTSKAIDSMNNFNNSQEIDSMVISSDKDIIIDANKNYKDIEEYLLRNCKSMKVLLSSRDLESKTSVSNKRKAKKFYDKGLGFFEKSEFIKAIIQYEKAIEADSKFAFAWDMLGYSYRKLEKYEMAITYYKKSLLVDPKGKMPLINITYAYEFLKEYDEALAAWDNYIAIFPNEAEGYYGRGRIHHLKLDYKNALDNMMKAYLIYNEVKSPYAADAEKNLAMFYNELEEKNQLDLFFQIAKKYDIKINE
ncbi:MAG: hypothetical protein COA50_04350 [Flavobacteriaceae bacterium]|nr:MAG: hypothetical protein COA50_04350 [Flavobacteriaceae bacterium]